MCVGGRREEEEEEAGGSAQPKTRTPHKDAGNNNHPKRKQTRNNRGLPTGQQLRPCFLLLGQKYMKHYDYDPGMEGCLHMKVKVRFTPLIFRPPHPEMYWVKSRATSRKLIRPTVRGS